METKFVADSMLGSLAKWLRVLGYDTHYQSSYPQGVIEARIREGRRLLSRNKVLLIIDPGALIIQADRAEAQLMETVKRLHLVPDRSRWFSRCLVCNVPLRETDLLTSQKAIPDYVLYENPSAIRHCPACKRYFWPGSHRERMLERLRTLGF